MSHRDNGAASMGGRGSRVESTGRSMRISKSIWLAVGVAAAVALWMLSGLGREPEPATQASTSRGEPAATHVTVQTSRASVITREVVVSARTEPNRSVELRAETAGRVVSLGAERGAAVKAGERIVALDLRDRQAKLDEARAAIAHADLQLEAARKLKTQQFVSDTQMAELLSRVAAARASLAEIELEVAHTDIAAPFDAVLQERAVEIGHYVSSGDTIAELVDIDPLIVVGEVSEREIHELAVGRPGTARLVDGGTVHGTLRYLAPVAAESTRTFRVELAIPNRDGRLRAGTTAEMRLAADEVEAHVLSPSLLTLDDQGTVGVKAVNARNEVVFHAVQIVASSDAGITVTGLPREAKLITVGQGFVRPGDRVVPAEVPAHAELSAADDLTTDRRATR
jgi:membrane fusion protein, multidrug efflux system